MTEKLMGNFEDVGEELIGVLSAPDIIYEANYNLLFNRPKINGVELEGDKSWDDLGLDLSPYATMEWVEDNYYTKTQTTEQIANEIDTYDDIVKSYLLNYYTKVEADGKFALKSEIPDDFYSKAETDELISEVEEKIPTDFYTKAETDEKIGAVDMTAVQALNTGSYANQRIDGLGDTYETKIAAEGFKRSISAEVDELRTNMPTNLSQLTPDTTHRTVTDEQIAEWNAKSEFDGDYNSLANKPTIPSRVAELSDASEYAKKSDIPTDYATQDDIDTALNTPMSDVATVEGVGYEVVVAGNVARVDMLGGKTVVSDDQLINVTPTSVETVGKNLANFVGTIMTETTASLHCPLKKGTYTFSVVSDESVGAYILISVTGAVSTYINPNGAAWSNPLTFTLSNDVDDIVVYSNTTKTLQVQIEKGSTATPYEPYRRLSFSLEALTAKYFPTGMKSAGSVYDELDLENKVAIQRVGSVDLGTLDWYCLAYRFASAPFMLRVDGTKEIISNVLCDKYEASDAEWTDIPDKHINIRCMVVSAGYYSIIIVDSDFDNPTDFKSSLTGVILNYELATPIITPITESVNPLLDTVDGGTLTINVDNPVSGVPYKVQTGIMTKLWKTTLDKGGSAPVPSSGGMELLFEGVTSQASPADLSNIEDYHAILIGIGTAPVSDYTTHRGINLLTVADLMLMPSGTKRFETYVYGSYNWCAFTQDKKLYCETAGRSITVYGIK